MTRGVGSRPCRSQQGATQIPKGTPLLEGWHHGDPGDGTTGTLPWGHGQRGHLTQPRELSQRCLPKSAPAQTRARPASCRLARRNPALCKRLARPTESCLESGACPVTLSPHGRFGSGAVAECSQTSPRETAGRALSHSSQHSSRSLFSLPCQPCLLAFPSRDVAPRPSNDEASPRGPAKPKAGRRARRLPRRGGKKSLSPPWGAPRVSASHPMGRGCAKKTGQRKKFGVPPGFGAQTWRGGCLRGTACFSLGLGWVGASGADPGAVPKPRQTHGTGSAARCSPLLAAAGGAPVPSASGLCVLGSKATAFWGVGENPNLRPPLEILGCYSQPGWVRHGWGCGGDGSPKKTGGAPRGAPRSSSGGCSQGCPPRPASPFCGVLAGAARPRGSLGARAKLRTLPRPPRPVRGVRTLQTSQGAPGATPSWPNQAEGSTGTAPGEEGAGEGAERGPRAGAQRSAHSLEGSRGRVWLWGQRAGEVWAALGKKPQRGGTE